MEQFKVIDISADGKLLSIFFQKDKMKFVIDPVNLKF